MIFEYFRKKKYNKLLMELSIARKMHDYKRFDNIIKENNLKKFLIYRDLNKYEEKIKKVIDK